MKNAKKLIVGPTLPGILTGVAAVVIPIGRTARINHLMSTEKTETLI